MTQTCNDCENFMPLGGFGSAAGYCKAQPTGKVLSYKSVKFNDDASKCPHFKAVDPEDVITDGLEASWHPMRRLHSEIEES